MNRPKQYDREVVLEKATEIFWAKGFEATSMSELASQMNLNAFSIYNEFGDKNGLFLACIDNFIGNYCFVEEILSKEPLGLKNIEAFFEYKMQSYNLEGDKGCLVFNSVIEEESISNEANKKVEAFIAKMRTLYRNCLIAAQKKNEISSDKNCKALADYLSLFTYGLVNLGMKKMSKKELRNAIDLALLVVKS